MDTKFKIYYLILFFSIGIFFSTQLHANERLFFEHITTEDGLSNGSVFKTFRDSKGFIWICTEDGLNKYDGYSFKKYNPIIDNKVSINSNQVIDIIEDQYFNLWLGTSNGLFIYNRKKDNFTRIESNKSNGDNYSILKGQINCLLFDNENRLWVGTYMGLCRIDKLEQNINFLSISNFNFYFKLNSNPKGISDNRIFSIQQGKDNEIWLTSVSNNIDHFNPQNNNFEHIEIQFNKRTNPSILIKKIFLDNAGGAWIYTTGSGLIYWDIKTNKFEQITIKGENGKILNTSLVQSLMIDKNENIWIGTDGNGIIKINKNHKIIGHYKKDESYFSNLSSNAIYSIYEDKFGTLWVGTYLTGINKLEKTKSSFGLIQKSENTISGLNHNITTSFCEDYKGNIWVSTDGGGINILNPKTLKFSHLLHDPTNPNSISTNTTLKVFEDIDKNMWIGTYEGGLDYYNPKTKRFKHYKYDPKNEKSISSNNPWSFVQDKNKNLWIATIDGGLNLLKYGSKSFIRYKELFQIVLSPNHIRSNALTYLFIDSNDNLWISTETGFDIVDLKIVDFSENEPKLIFKHFQNYPNQNSISSNRTSHIIEDHEGNIWIATKGGGLNKYNAQTGKFKTYTTTDGLPHNIINGILEDEKHFLWISSNMGLSKFDPKSEVFISYGLSDGIQSNEFYKTSCLKSSTGMLYFGGINGFNAFHPENIKSNTEIPTIVITDFKLFNQKVEIGEEINNHILLPVAISELDNIRLDHSQNFISFGFTALNYTSPEKNQYAYKMEGFDNEFRHVDSNNRVATYTNLDPGNYTFKVLASNNEGVWNKKGTSITITITPPWWKTWWFKIASSLILIGIIILFFLIRFENLKKQKKNLENIVNERTQQLQEANIELKEINATKDKFVSIIAHDIMNPFNAILGFSELLVNNKSWPEKRKSEIATMIFDSSKRLYELLENLLKWSKSEGGLLKFNPQLLNVKKIITKNYSVLKPAAKAKDINLSTSYPKSEIEIFSDPQIIDTILRNLVSNAIKFTHPNGNIHINIGTLDDFAYISISDNGIGISAENIKKIVGNDKHQSTIGTNNEKGSGLGLVLVKEFVSKQGGEFFIESTLDKGSTFTFTVPLHAPKI